MESVRGADLNNKRVLVRVDYNVPIKNGVVGDLNRIKKSLPTLNFLLEHKVKIVLITHLGKPKGEIDTEFSTVPLARELSNLLGRKVMATDHLVDDRAYEIAGGMEFGDILMLGNLRWNPGEEENDEKYAEALAKFGDIYVNDAFGVSHRAHASVSKITEFLPSYSGFLLDNEIETLTLILKNPVRPFVLIMGGAKIKDKSGLIENLSDKVDKILVGGAIANTFAAANGEEVSESLTEPEMYEASKQMREKLGEKLVLPIDSVRDDIGDGKFKIMDIGPESLLQFGREIERAKTVFWNGNMGYSEDERFVVGTRGIAEALSKLEGTKVVAGGDTAGFVNDNGYADKMSFVSTGGGAALEFLAGEPMPGVEALNKSMKNIN